MRAATAAALVAVATGVCAAPGAGAESSGRISIRFLQPTTPTHDLMPVVMPVRVVNGWTGRAVGVTLTATAPSWVKLSGAGCAARTSALTCPLPDLAAGADVTVRITAGPSRYGTYRLSAHVTVRDFVRGADAKPRSPAGAAPFRGVVTPISTALARSMTGVSWRPGCPVGLSDLRAVRVSYWGFDAKTHTGTLVVNRSVAAQVVRVLSRLYAARFPIRRMVPVDVYGGDDFRSIEADNTSAFNCRAATGSSRWSEHAYGRAIDLDPLENPYVTGGTTSHGASRRYLDRSRRLPGMIHEGDVVVRAFAVEGWGWGGTWSGGVRDYQHFSASGR